MSTLAIVLIVLGVLVVLGIGTCAAGLFVIGSAAKKAVGTLADGGGLVMVSPPAVKAELAGPKKDYVGDWRSAHGSTLSIDADGNMKLDKNESAGSHETLTAPIAEFHGNDMIVKALITLTFSVTKPPHIHGDHWEMSVDGVDFERKK